MTKDLAKSTKFYSLPFKLLIVMVVGSFILGNIAGTIVTYLLLYIKPENQFNFDDGKETHQVMATVKEIIDGDTIVVQINDREMITVRYLGIDAPENKGIEGIYYGKESHEKNDQLVGGKQVKLIYGGKLQTASQRLIAYVYVGGIFVNVEMLKEGFAAIYRRNTAEHLVTHPHYEDFYRIEQEAKSKQIGIWNIKRKTEWEQRHGIISSLHPNNYIADDICFHRPQCPRAEEIKFKVYYYDRQNAICDHKLPCSTCKP